MEELHGSLLGPTVPVPCTVYKDNQLFVYEDKLDNWKRYLYTIEDKFMNKHCSNITVVPRAVRTTVEDLQPIMAYIFSCSSHKALIWLRRLNSVLQVFWMPFMDFW